VAVRRDHLEIGGNARAGRRVEPGYGQNRLDIRNSVVLSTNIMNLLMPTPTDARDRLILALDFPSVASALAHVERLEGRCRWFKVGLELYLASGGAMVAILREMGFEVFLDLKLHDIPNTVAGAVRSVSSLGASLLTVHASGGCAMMAAAVQAAAATPGAPRLLAVTVLTSIDAAQLASIGVAGTPAEQVLRLGRLAAEAGITGLVCSPEEVATLRTELGADPLLVVPGIRPAGAAVGDQRRVATPAAAIGDGASMLVVGRPITQAADPAAVADAILAEMSG
jgi:orotidine-5'-phosphate decarboxylase